MTRSLLADDDRSQAAQAAVLELAADLKRAPYSEGTALLVRDPVKAVDGAEVVVTDTWVSMGKESEAEARLLKFAAYTVTAELLAHASPDAIVMHCLPAYRGKEIDADVLDGPQSVVWDEAENRRHAQKAIITWLLQQSGEQP
jgi:ornithine carbamoyltransferase